MITTRLMLYVNVLLSVELPYRSNKKGKKCPQIYFTQFLDDINPAEREFGLKAGLQLLSECDELYYFGNVISKGMKTEICYAVEHKISVLYIHNCEHEEYSKHKAHNEEVMFDV